MNPIDLLRYQFGELKVLADHLGLKSNTVYLWGRSHIPVKYIKEIEELSQGKLTKEMLRPDLFKKD